MMAGGLHYQLNCAVCGSTIPLHERTLAQAFGFPVPQSTNVKFAVLVCDRCKQAKRYVLDQTSPNWGGVVLLPWDSDWEFLGFRRCEEETCEIRLAVFARVNKSISAEDQAKGATAWVWDGLTCPAGHTIPKPQEDQPES